MAKYIYNSYNFSQCNTSNLWFIGGENMYWFRGNMHFIGYSSIDQKLTLESNAILWWIKYLGRMRYSKKVRLALALLIVLVALIVEVLWWNLDS